MLCTVWEGRLWGSKRVVGSRLRSLAGLSAQAACREVEVRAEDGVSRDAAKTRCRDSLARQCRRMGKD